MTGSFNRLGASLKQFVLRLATRGENRLELLAVEVVGGLSALGAGLYSLGIPKDSILRYETALKAGKYVVIAHGSEADATQAKEILHRTHAEALDHHQ